MPTPVTAACEDAAQSIAVATAVGMIALVTKTGCGADTQSAVTPGCTHQFRPAEQRQHRQ